MINATVAAKIIVLTIIVIILIISDSQMVKCYIEVKVQ